jgi:hypothetical protein
MMRRYIPSTVASLSAIWTLRSSSLGFAARWASLTAFSERFSQKYVHDAFFHDATPLISIGHNHLDVTWKFTARPVRMDPWLA